MLVLAPWSRSRTSRAWDETTSCVPHRTPGSSTTLRINHPMAFVSVVRRIAIPAAIAIASSPVVNRAIAQGGGPPQQQPYENLKYFSKDLPRDSLFTIMRGFTYAL